MKVGDLTPKMHKSNAFEIVAGVFVLICTVFLFFFSFNKLYYAKDNYKDCYKIYGLFSDTNGIEIGDSVKIAGIDVGKIVDLKLNKSTYVACIEMCISRDIKLPTDSVAIITGHNPFVGSKFINILPGSNMELIGNGGKLQHVQSGMNIAGMLDKVLNMVIR